MGAAILRSNSGRKEPPFELRGALIDSPARLKLNHKPSKWLYFCYKPATAQKTVLLKAGLIMKIALH